MPTEELRQVAVDNPPLEINIYNVLIVDKSGSMAPLRDSIISTFNEQVQTIKANELKYPDQKNYVTVATFNQDMTVHFENSPLTDLNEFTVSDYKPDGMTALRSSVGSILTRLKTYLGNDWNNPQKNRVVVTMLTDGNDNASSSDWNKARLGVFLSDVQSAGWVVTLLGANIDLEQLTRELNLDATNVLQFNHDPDSVRRMSATMSDARTMYSARVMTRSTDNTRYYNPQ